MNDKQSKRRWEKRRHRVPDKKIIEDIKMGIPPDRIEGLCTYNIHGAKYFDLSGMTIEDEVLDISKLWNIDFSHTRFINVQFTSEKTLSNFRFESADLLNVSFKSTNQNINTRFILDNFVFNGARIEKSDFSQNDFSGRNYFLNSRLYDVDFSDSNFKKSIFCDFKGSIFQGCGFSNSILTGCVLCNCLFSDCDLRNTRFNMTNLSGIAFKNCIVNSKTTFDEKIILEKNKSFEYAYEAYIQIKNLFRNTGHFLESQKFYLREIHTRGKKEKKGIKKIVLMALAHGAKYCQKPWHVLGYSFLSLLFFALAYLYTGIGSSNEAVPEKNFFQCLYFSVVTFTTLGYGDLKPISGCTKFLASIEAILGPAFLSFFMASLIKKTIQE